MSARAPQAIQSLFADVHTAIPKAVLSGIVGDTAHSFGYHLARRDLPASDYSVQLGPDRLGADDCASALDISLPPDLMITLTRRLHSAAQAHDPRLKALREFCGTVDGSRTFPWDVYHGDISEGINTWDDSHLWHIHLSFLRQYADHYASLAPIAAVLAGVPLPIDVTDPHWSDMATQADIQKMIVAEVDRRLRAAVFGGNVDLNKLAPGLYPAAGAGLTDRLHALEQK